MHATYMTAEEINLVLGALAFLEGQSMVDPSEKVLLKDLACRLALLTHEESWRHVWKP